MNTAAAQAELEKVRLEDVHPCASCGARPLGVCADLKGHELQSMACASESVSAQPGQALFHEGDPNPYVFNVVDGAVKLYRLLPDGRRQITGFLFQGDFLGLGGRGASSFTAEALTPLKIPSQLPSTLLNRRPDIVQAERQLIAADASLAASRASLLPSFNLTAGGSIQDRTLPALLDNPLQLWSLGGSILAPLLNRQALNAQVDISQSQRNQALYGYEKTVRNAFREVNDSLDAITRYQEQLQELQAQQVVAQETLRIAQRLFLVSRRAGRAAYAVLSTDQRGAGEK